MCNRLIQEYKIWLDELLVVLQRVCENVVPVGRLDEDIYWRTKRLWKMSGAPNRQLASELFRYAQEGRKLIVPVREAIEAWDGEISEEDQICLRREYATQILNSLQMLVNCYFMGTEFLQYSVESMDRHFEIDTSDEVRRVRSGACVIEEVCLPREGALVSTLVFRKIS